MNRGRPRLPVGQHGLITTTQQSDGKWVSYARFRGKDGRLRPSQRIRPTKAAAHSALLAHFEALRNSSPHTSKKDSTVAQLGARFLERKSAVGRSTGTMTTYGYAVDAHINPLLGDLLVSDLTAGVLQDYLSRIAEERGAGAATNSRKVLSGMMTIAVRDGRLTTNPVRELERIEKGKSRVSKAIPLDQVPAFVAKVRANPELQRLDLVDLFIFMLMTGWRVGEVCGLHALSVDFEAATATVEATAVRIKGKGMIRQPLPKTDASKRITPLPSEMVALLRERRDRFIGDTDQLFPSFRDLEVRDPGEVQKQLRALRAGLGYPNLSTHSFRKTVATRLDSEGMSAAEIAAYLGHANPSVTQDVYLRNSSTGFRKASQAMSTAASEWLSSSE